MKPKTQIDIKQLVRKNILTMKPYSSARDEFKGEAEVFLDANENPYNSAFNRYPDPLQWEVKTKLAKLKGIDPTQIFLGNGSDEAIDVLIRAFCEPNRDAILITEPTYGMYAVCADVNAVTIQKVLLTADYDLDLESLFKQVNDQTKIIFLCSPNNPTANLLTREKIKTVLAQFNGLVVIDEAYIDFTSSESFAAELSNYENLVILQTFSKAWGLAGLRLGMCFASPAIIGILNKVKYPYNINLATQAHALEALKDVQKKDAMVAEITSERDALIEALPSVKMVQKVYPSDANFILIKVDDANGTYQKLTDQKIIVRNRSSVALCLNCLRITVGTPEENKRLLQALKDLSK
ncbi:histidinol-phosphate transaminase [Pseudochryseolinea flava]|uniref:Histidinol-phosphate aminotransferase n=1 Tax=Pseudochryseolinea flava TaxID=2059302 RepID=A0A364XWU4_9BACT|nr:histidinol-phosphate transaminase [Pseudochryseolinea flava]RAV98651.1 histidinol-phosphate transaminase [Pseudochryseolinea flava]